MRDDSFVTRPAGRWLYILPLCLLTAASWLAVSSRRRPDFSAAGLEAGTDQSDPKRFRVIEPGVIEDTSTGQRRRTGVAPTGMSPSGLAELFAESGTVSFPSDLRQGFGPRPVRLEVPVIGIDADVVPIGTDATNALVVPRRADVTGWWSGGSVPGEDGPTVIVGHYDSKRAPGVFERLKLMRVGQKITVVDSRGERHLFVVSETEHLLKSAFPRDKVYAATQGSTLRLVTCGGQFNRSTGHYVENYIVYADLVVVKPVVQGYPDDLWYREDQRHPYWLAPDTVVDTGVDAVVASETSDPGTSTTTIASPTATSPTATSPTATSTAPASPTSFGPTRSGGAVPEVVPTTVGPPPPGALAPTLSPSTATASAPPSPSPSTAVVATTTTAPPIASTTSAPPTSETPVPVSTNPEVAPTSPNG